MANNPYINKVEYGGNTLIDLTGDTVTASVLLVGYTAHGANGAPVTGSMNSVTLTAPSSGTRYFDITVPNGNNNTVTFRFTVDASGNTTVTGGELI